MSRKDYEAIAAAVREVRALFAAEARHPYPERDDVLIGIDATVKAVADALANDNPRFDRTRFLVACNVTV